MNKLTNVQTIFKCAINLHYKLHKITMENKAARDSKIHVM